MTESFVEALALLVLVKVVRKKNYLNQGLCHITRFLKAALDKVTLTHLWEQLLCWDNPFMMQYGLTTIATKET